MSDITTLTPEELTELREGPALAGAIVASASPNLMDMFSEMGAAVRKIAAAKKEFPNNALIGRLIPDAEEAKTAETPKMPEIPSGADAAGRQAALVAELAKIAAIADKYGVEGAEYKKWVYSVSVAVAESAKEGDFLGFGGVLVSEDEKTALAAIAGALNVTP
jgi:hypothetical protein